MKGQRRKHGNDDSAMSKERIFMEAFSLGRNESGEEAGASGEEEDEEEEKQEEVEEECGRACTRLRVR